MKNQLSLEHPEAIITAAFKQQNQALLAYAMDYLDRLSAGDSLGIMTTSRIPIEQYTPEDRLDIRPPVVYAQNIQSDNELITEQPAVLITHYSKTKSKLLRAAILMPHLQAFKDLNVQLEQTGLLNPVKATILAYHNFCDKTPNLSFIEQEANLLLSLNRVDNSNEGNEGLLLPKKTQ